MYTWNLSYYICDSFNTSTFLTDCEKYKANRIVAQFCDEGFHFQNVNEQFKKGVGIN